MNSILEEQEFPTELDWVRDALRPVREPYRAPMSRYVDQLVWHLDIELKSFTPPQQLAVRWTDKKVRDAETFGGKTLVVGEDSGCETAEGQYSVGEVETAARLRKRGRAYWISEFSGYDPQECWTPFYRLRRRLPNFGMLLGEAAPDVVKNDADIRRIARFNPRDGGHPDVVAWLPGTDEAVYIEYKGPNDAIKKNSSQERWALAAIEMGHPYLIVRGIILQPLTRIPV